jgi:hypothetical protein
LAQSRVNEASPEEREVLPGFFWSLSMQSEDPKLMERARRLMKDDAAPPEMLDDYIERARELIAQEKNGSVARIPVQRTIVEPGARPFGEPVEPVDEAVRNLGEFPTLTDQGEEPLFPDEEEAQTVNSQ